MGKHKYFLFSSYGLISRFFGTTIISLFLFHLGIAQCGLLSNPSLEEGAFQGDTMFEGFSAHLITDLATALPNFTVEYSGAGGGFWIDGKSAVPNATNPDGDYFAWFPDSSFSIRQDDIVVTAGNCYEIRVNVAPWTDGDGSQTQEATQLSLQVQGGGFDDGMGGPLTLLDQIILPDTTGNFDSLNWQTVVFLWEPSSSGTASFIFEQSGDGGLAIDHLCLNEAANCGLLPVQLTTFTAENDRARDVMLHWATASELNFDRFDVEYSVDGMHFERLGSVASQGSTNEETNYHYRHLSALDGSVSTLFYRLRQVDLDGSVEYSSIASLKLNAQTESFQFYPNPVTGSQDVVTIQGPDIQTVTIFDIAGKLVKEFKSKEPSTMLDLSVADLHRGSYILMINHVAAKKLTILD